MHRSGTSLLASFAAQAGVDMGAELMAAGKGNRRGHFEDLEFVRFHDALLELRGAAPLRPPEVGVTSLAAEEERQARELVARRAGKPLWGWKDPRTTLFLRPWDSLLPAPFYLLVYRHPVEVALSLLRRGVDLEVQLNPWTAIRCWTVYNSQLLAFSASHPERSLLWPISSFTADPGAAMALLEERFGQRLDGRGLERLYAPAELRQTLVARDIDWRAVLPEAMALHDQLEEGADLPGGLPGEGAGAEPAPPPRERDLQEAAEHLLATSLVARWPVPTDLPPPRQAEVSPAQWIAYSEPKRLVALQEERIAELQRQVLERAAEAERLAGRLHLLSRERARVEATRAWRAVHSYWETARRLRGWRRQTGWYLGKLAGTARALRPEEILVGCVAGNHPQGLTQAGRLVRSLRWFGGSLAGARTLVCVVGELAAEERRTLERLGAEVRIVAPFDPRNPKTNKLQFFEAALASGAGGLLLLDCDTAVVADPMPLLARGALQARIADVPSVTHEVFARLFGHFGLRLPRRRYRTTLLPERTILYCNSGVIFLPSELAREFVPVWREWNARLLDAPELLGRCAHHSNQASLSLALAAHPIPFVEAPAALNFPLHMTHLPPPAALFATDPVILHYHDEVDAAGLLLPSAYPRAQARIEAFNRRVAEESHAGIPPPR